MFELFMVNEPSVFELLRFDCSCMDYVEGKCNLFSVQQAMTRGFQALLFRTESSYFNENRNKGDNFVIKLS